MTPNREEDCGSDGSRSGSLQDISSCNSGSSYPGRKSKLSSDSMSEWSGLSPYSSKDGNTRGGPGLRELVVEYRPFLISLAEKEAESKLSFDRFCSWLHRPELLTQNRVGKKMAGLSPEERAKRVLFDLLRIRPPVVLLDLWFKTIDRVHRCKHLRCPQRFLRPLFRSLRLLKRIGVHCLPDASPAGPWNLTFSSLLSSAIGREVRH